MAAWTGGQCANARLWRRDSCWRLRSIGAYAERKEAMPRYWIHPLLPMAKHRASGRPLQDAWSDITLDLSDHSSHSVVDSVGFNHLIVQADRSAQRKRRFYASICPAHDSAGVNDGSSDYSGGPGSYPTIQSAIDAATSGDTVLMAPGTYTGEGNRNLANADKSLTFIGAAGRDNTIIDVEGQAYDAFRLGPASDGGYTTLKGMTITGAQWAVANSEGSGLSLIVALL